MRRWITGLLAWAALAAVGGVAAAQPAGFGDWAAVVVAADWRAADGSDAPIFDNARRDLVAGLTRAGFTSANIAQFSSAAEPEAGVQRTTIAGFLRGAEAVTARAQGGCLFYLTSHGAPQGIIFGREGGLTPETLGGLVDRWCGQRPTVVVVSACYSGVFIPALEGDNRMVLTAARPDRTSFGCGNTNRYPYFDECVLQTLPRSRDLPALAAAATSCVARREAAEGLTPPSEPQVSIGDAIRPVLARLPLSTGAPIAANDDAVEPDAVKPRAGLK